MEIKVKTKREILEETYKFYSEDVSRRSMDGANCVYNSNDGKQCALGRCCNEIPKDFNYEDSYTIFDRFGFHILKPEYRIEDEAFWAQLQSFHDFEDNWNEKGITEKGIKFYESLLKEYGNN